MNDQLDEATWSPRLLRTFLSQIANLDDIAAALGIADQASQPAEFWDIQQMTARNRFLALCLERCGMPLSLELGDLSDAQAAEVAEMAESLLDAGVRYTQVRTWFLQRGALALKLAFDLRREQRKFSELGLRVLLVFDKGAKYLAYGPEVTDIRLVDSPKDAFVLPVHSQRETEKTYLQELAGLFDAVKAQTGAREVKVLCGART